VGIVDCGEINGRVILVKFVYADSGHPIFSSSYRKGTELGKTPS
jgi:hypothetical protein